MKLSNEDEVKVVRMNKSVVTCCDGDLACSDTWPSSTIFPQLSPHPEPKSGCVCTAGRGNPQMRTKKVQIFTKEKEDEFLED